jgi:hypothetical protein
LNTTTVPQTEYDFTAACESWAQSLDLDIFNHLSQPFQTRPIAPVQQEAAFEPVQEATQVPVQQGTSTSLAPVHQAELEIPVHQANIPQPGIPTLL